jgi:hypothetical protein
MKIEVDSEGVSQFGTMADSYKRTLKSKLWKKR